MTQLLYPIGIQSFPNIREGGYIYVDKTSYIHRLVTTGKYYFLSRPRRFGKSLLMSTIEEFFKGQRDLFEGLAISDYDYDWAEYPVLHLDLSGFIVESRESLYIHLEDFFSRWEERFSIIMTSHFLKQWVSRNCRNIIGMYCGRYIVILRVRTNISNLHC